MAGEHRRCFHQRRQAIENDSALMVERHPLAGRNIMGKNKKKKKSNPTGDVGAKDTQDKNPAEKIKLKNKEYEAELFTDRKSVV